MNPTSNDEATALFRDVALVLGGVFAIHPIDDETMWEIATGLRRA